MNPNSRQVYTSISSADRLCMSHTVSILFFSFFLFLGMGGVRGRWARGDVWICFFSKILPETKSKRSSSQCTLPTHTHTKTEVKRNVQKFHVLTFTSRTVAVCFFTPQLFGCSPPLSPPAFSPPQKTRTPSHQSSSFLAWISLCKPSMPGL